MAKPENIPVFTLFGETEHFPDVVHCEHFSARAPIHGWHISAHRHAQMVQLFLVKSGHIDATVDSTHITITANRFLFVPADKVHTFTFQPDTEGLVISVPVNVVNTMGPAGSDIGSILSTPHSGQSGKELDALAEQLSATIAQQSAYRAQRAVGLSHAILGLVADLALDANTTHQTHGNDRLMAFNRLIAEQMSQGWGAAQYAAAMAITPGHLSRICRAATGSGATAYLERTIMEEACRLLAFTRLPIAEIGYRLGFSDPSYFSKRFGKVTKASPSQYRARYVA